MNSEVIDYSLMCNTVVENGYIPNQHFSGDVAASQVYYGSPANGNCSPYMPDNTYPQESHPPSLDTAYATLANGYDYAQNGSPGSCTYSSYNSYHINQAQESPVYTDLTHSHSGNNYHNSLNYNTDCNGVINYSGSSFVDSSHSSIPQQTHIAGYISSENQHRLDVNSASEQNSSSCSPVSATNTAPNHPQYKWMQLKRNSTKTGNFVNVILLRCGNVKLYLCFTRVY